MRCKSLQELCLAFNQATQKQHTKLKTPTNKGIELKPIKTAYETREHSNINLKTQVLCQQPINARTLNNHETQANKTTHWNSRQQNNSQPY